MKRYLFIVQGGTEPYTLGPYNSDEERLAAAQDQCKNHLQRAYDSIFYLDTDSDGVPNAGSFTDEELYGEDARL